MLQSPPYPSPSKILKHSIKRLQYHFYLMGVQIWWYFKLKIQHIWPRSWNLNTAYLSAMLAASIDVVRVLYLKICSRTQTLFCFLGLLIPMSDWTSGDVCPGFQSKGGSLACFLVIWYYTSSLQRGQHGSQTFSMNVLADHVSTSIGGGSNQRQSVVRVHEVIFSDRFPISGIFFQVWNCFQFQL